MKQRLCAVTLFLEAIVLGLTTPVLISVQHVDTAKALWVGLGLAVLCVVAAGTLRRPWGYWLGWLIQLAAVILGFQIGVMFALGIVFFALWVASFMVGNQVDTDRHLAELQHPAEPVVDVPAPPRWDHELVCGPETWRPFAAQAFRDTWTAGSLSWCAACLVLGVALVALVPQARPVGWLLIAAVALFPSVTWLAQRQAWRSFLRPGRSYRTTFGPHGLVLEVSGRLLDVPYADITAISTENGLVTSRLAARGLRFDLPQALFPAPRVEEVRRLIGARSAG